MIDLDDYLISSNFDELCRALDFIDEDVDEIKRKLYDLEDKSNIEDSIALAIYSQMLNYKDAPSKEVMFPTRYHRWISDDYDLCREEYFYQVYIRNLYKWEDIKNKLTEGIESGKINSDYLFEKEYYQELDLIPSTEVENALNAIYLHEVRYILNSYDISKSVRKAMFKDCCKSYYANPLLFNEIKEMVEYTLDIVLSEPLIYLKDYSDMELWSSFILIEHKEIVWLIDSYLEKLDPDYIVEWSDYLIANQDYMNSEKVFYVMSCGSDFKFKQRSDFSDIFIIKKELLEKSGALLISQSSELGNKLMKYKETTSKFDDSKIKEKQIKKYDDFKVTTYLCDDKKYHIFDALNPKMDVDYNHDDLFEIACQKPLSEEFCQLISSLNLSVDDAYEIQKSAKNSKDVLAQLIKRDISQMDDYDESDLKEIILNKQVDALIEFRELDFSYAEILKNYLKDKDIIGNDLPNFLNGLLKHPKSKQKTCPDGGKFAAPRWLVYPELDAYTMGWRMGYGEQYALNEPWHSAEFAKLFPKPKNWLFDPGKSDFEMFPLLGFFWRDDGKPKYNQIGNNAIEVNDFITISQPGEFQYNSVMFKSIEHAVLISKVSLFKNIDIRHTSLNTLKRDYKLDKYDLEYWQNFKYTVLLNACYYKFMNDDGLKEKLLATGDKSLVYLSDDEWGGESNLFGFALMELRDEIRRLYKNQDLIDWEYTEYLKHKNPYENPIQRDPNDEQSPEYMIMSSTLEGSEKYVRDVNLESKCFEKYETGQIITEKAIVDATNKIGGLKTSHRYLILSNQMKDLSSFERDTDWGLHLTKANSRFKVLDIYTKEDKTQILLLQLPEGFDVAFENSNKLTDEAIEDARNLFDECLKKEPIKQVNTDEWLERVSFPLGMDNEGNLF